MLAYPTKGQNDLVKIDANHAEFLRTLVMCTKPVRILELGFGAGEATRQILAGLRYNQRSFEYTLVDNWVDFGGIQPELTKTEEFRVIKFVTSNEYDFVKKNTGTYNFIFSDADHHNTQLWFDHVYTNLLDRDGVLIYHDVTNPLFPNLLRIYTDVLQQNCDHILLRGNSRPEERCDRGMLVIMKH